MNIWNHLKGFALRSSIDNDGIGLALGSGGLKMFFHIGVLEALEENHIPVKMIAGTSAGALVGAMYAAGTSIEALKEFSIKMDKKKIMDLATASISLTGLFTANNAMEYFKEILNNITFEELKIPFYAVATDLITGDKVVFDSGEVATAIRASSSLPGVFEPVILDDMVLADGGIVENVPIPTLKKHWHGAVLGACLEAPIKKSHKIRLKENESPLDNISKHIPLIKDMNFFKHEKHVSLDSNILLLTLRSWDIIAYKKLQYDLRKTPPDVLITIDPEFNPEIEEMKPEYILSLIEHGRLKTTQALRESRIIR